MAFLLRVSYVCKNAAAAVEVIRALRTMAAHQLDHPHRGVVVYLFARPDPLHRPCELEFFELYSNEASFWEHTMDREVRRAFLRGFDASNKHSVAWFSYGNMSALVRQTCIGFGSAFPRTEAGFILADAKRAASPLLGRVTDGSAAVLVRWLFTDPRRQRPSRGGHHHHHHLVQLTRNDHVDHHLQDGRQLTSVVAVEITAAGRAQ